MTEYVRVASLWDLPPGERMAVWISGIKVMVINVGGEIFAVDEQCTHMQCSLMTGPLKETTIGCPCHLAAFDLRTGKVLRGPATIDLPTYEVKIEKGDIYVEETPPEAI